MKMKKLLALLLAALMILTLFAGCGSDTEEKGKDDGDKEKTTSSVADSDNKDDKTNKIDDEPTDVDPDKEIATFERIESETEKVYVTYDKNTGIVDKIKFERIVLSSNEEEYFDAGDSFESLKIQYDEIGCENISVDLVNDDDHAMIAITYSDLTGDNREASIDLLSFQIGIKANPKDMYIYYDDAESGLIADGFVKK